MSQTDTTDDAPDIAEPTTDTPKPAQDPSEAFLARFPAIPGAYPTRFGNSAGGTSESLPPGTPNRTFHNGAFVRLSIPLLVTRVGLEYDPNGKEYLRLHSDWNEGGWHETMVDPLTGRVIGGMWDMPFPRQDRENWTPENGWQYGTGYWAANRHHFTDRWSREHLERYTNTLRFVEIPEGRGKGVNGYEWTNTGDYGFVLTTPKGLKIYALAPFETAVTDPANASLAFTQYHALTLSWASKGQGKEVKGFAPTFDWERFPTDPRRTPAPLTHPGPLGAVRVGASNDLYVFSGANEILLHKWDAKAKLLAPVAAVYLGPNQFPASIPNHPTVTWGQGAKTQVDAGGNFAGAWETFDASVFRPGLKTFDAKGSLWLMPRWERGSGHDGVYWKVFDIVRGVFHADNIKALVLPDALKSAERCDSTRVDWKSGDLFAVVRRGAQWCLERYAGYRDASGSDRASLKPAYSVGPVALTTRVEYNWYDTATGEAFGAMVPFGGYVFIAEAQHMGIRVHRASDGAIVGRATDPGYTNSTIDSPEQMQVTESTTEFRVFMMDFHGKAVLVWRVPKKGLK